MPTRKQRRRRMKEQRHEYVWEDGEGNELEPEEVPTRKASSQPQSTRGGRAVQPPSWNRTLKRGAIFAPIMFLVVMLLSKDLSLASQLVQAGIIVAIFIPFSYFLDSIFWRSYKKRQERQGAPGQRKG
jgi:hypothetical protein